MRIFSAAVVTVFLAVALDAGAAETSHSVEARFPSTGLRTVAIDEKVGRIDVHAAKDNSVHVKVVLIPRQHSFLGLFEWVDRETIRDLPKVKVHAGTSDGTLKLALEYPEDMDTDSLKTEWTVGMPQNLSADVDLNVGKLTVAEIAGGVKVRLNTGKAEIDIPKGAVDASVNVGELKVASESRDYASARLSAAVGDCKMSVGDETIGKDQGNSPPSSSITWHGTGKDVIRLAVKVGRSRLTLK